MAAPGSSAPPGRRYRPPLADTTVARGPPGAIQASSVSRPMYMTDNTSAAAAARAPHRRQGEEDRCGIAMTRRSPLMSASAARHAGQRLIWSSRRTRLPPMRAPLRYARNSGRNAAQPATAAFVNLSQTRTRAASSVPASTPSWVISFSALSSRSSAIPISFVLSLHLSLQSQPDSVEPDGYVVLLELELLGQLLVRQPLDVTQQEQGRVLANEGRDGAPELFFQQQCRLDGGMRRPIVVGRLGVDRPAAQEVDGRVDGGAPEVGCRPAGGFILFAPGQHAEEHGLQHVLGVRRTSGDTEGRAEHRLVVPLVQFGETRQRRRGSHLDGLDHVRAGRGHVVRHPHRRTRWPTITRAGTQGLASVNRAGGACDAVPLL